MQKLKPKANRKRTENTATSSFISIQIFGVVCYITVFTIFSLIALLADLPRQYDYYYTLAVFLLGSFLLGGYAGIKLRENGLLNGVIYALPMNVLTVLISLIFADFKADFHTIITVILLILSSAFGGVIAVNKRRRR